jgi:hypothetical protein
MYMQGDDSLCEAHTKTDVPDAKEDAPGIYTLDGDYLIMVSGCRSDVWLSIHTCSITTPAMSSVGGG